MLTEVRVWRKAKNGTEIEATPAYKATNPFAFMQSSLSGLSTEGRFHVGDPKEYKMELGDGDRIAEFRIFTKGSDPGLRNLITGLQEWD